MALLNYKESLIPDFIKNYDNTPVTYNTLHTQDTFQIGEKLHVITDDPVYAMYEPEFEDLKYEFEMSDAQYRRYAQNPKVLSFDLYGTTELWWMILEANEIYSASEMLMNPVIVFEPSVLRYLETILNVEKKSIDANREEVRKILTSKIIVSK